MHSGSLADGSFCFFFALGLGLGFGLGPPGFASPNPISIPNPNQARLARCSYLGRLPRILGPTTTLAYAREQQRAEPELWEAVARYRGIWGRCRGDVGEPELWEAAVPHPRPRPSPTTLT